MISITDGNIILTKGDTAAIILEFESEEPFEDAEAIVTVKRSAGDIKPLFEKRCLVSDNSVTVTLDTADTLHPFGKYLWDVRIIFANGTVITPIPPKAFVIAEVVGDV